MSPEALTAPREGCEGKKTFTSPQEKWKSGAFCGGEVEDSSQSPGVCRARVELMASINTSGMHGLRRNCSNFLFWADTIWSTLKGEINCSLSKNMFSSEPNSGANMKESVPL